MPTSTNPSDPNWVDDNPLVKDKYGFLHHAKEPVTLIEAVFQAIGEASVCWEHPSGAGAFDSTQANKIGNRLVAFIQDRMDREAAF